MAFPDTAQYNWSQLFETTVFDEAGMFGIGFQEMLIILVVVLIFFGPKRLPDLAKSMGKGLAEFKKASEEVRKGIEEAVKEEEIAPEPQKASPPPDVYPDPSGPAPKQPEGVQPHQESIPFTVPSRTGVAKENGSATPEADASEETTTPRQG
jgi:Tat protein translocase TatB subunit